MSEKRNGIEVELEQMGQKLHACNQLILSIMTRNRDGILIVDRGGIIRFANPAAAAIFDCREEELTGKRFEYPLESDNTIEIKVKKRDGKTITVEMCAVATEWQEDQAYYVSLCDISESIEMKEALKESEALFRIIFEQASQLMGLMKTDGTLIKMNRSAAEFIKAGEPEKVGSAFPLRILTPTTSTAKDTEGSVLGKLFWETPWWSHSPELQEQLRDAVRRASQGETVQFEATHKSPEGKIVWVDFSLTPVKDEKGNVVYLVPEGRDITERKMAEDALRFSEERYRALFRDNPTMIVTLDADFTMLSVNPVCASQLGYTIDELEGQSVLKLFHEADHPAVIEQLRRCLQNPDQVFRWQFHKIRKDGVFLWVEETAQAISDLRGVLNLLVVCQDITERKRVEEALRESENKFFKAFQATPNVLVIASLADGRYMEVNEAFERVMGYRRDEVIGRSALELNIWQNPQDRVVVITMLAEGKKVRDLEINFRSKSGAILVGLYSAEIIEIGAERCLLSLLNDITARKMAEEALRKSELKLSKIFHSVPALIGISTLNEGKFIDVNETCLRTLGYQREEIIGRTAHELGLWENESDRAKVVRLMEEQGSIQNIEVRFKGKAGQSLICQYSAELIVLDEERYILSLVRDITQRKYAEEEIERLNERLATRAADLEDANRELEAFNYTVAHDLRNPLNVISSYCQVFKEMCGDKLDEQCMRYIEETYDGTLRMNRLIEALLQFSRLAHAELHRDRVDLSSIAKEVAEEVKGAESARRVTFLIADGKVSNGDANLLRVVLANLFGNAWKYTAKREEGIIEFGMTEVDGKTAYFVRDNGYGFDNSTAEKIFAPFQRLPGAEECRGFGIGLATVERIIRRHGGRVWAEGEPGKGACFYFTLSANGSKDASQCVST